MPRENGLRNLRKIVWALFIRWHSLDEWFPVEPTVAIKKRPTLTDEVGIPKIERTVQVS
jgi:hypothetical protein